MLYIVEDSDLKGKGKKAGTLWHTRRVGCRKKIGKLVCPTQFQEVTALSV